MSRPPLSGRQLTLLAIVAEGAGKWDARWIDITIDSRNGPSETTVLQELQALGNLGLVLRDDSRSGVGGRWSVTEEGRTSLNDAGAGPRASETT